MQPELVVLGTASQMPTRDRNHNGYLLRWGREGVLFDPGEGTQRQLIHAGARSSWITRICLTHLHGDHSLGLPGILQRMTQDQVDHPVDLYYPARARRYVDGLLRMAEADDVVEVRHHPLEGGESFELDGLRMTTAPLRHRVATVGYRLDEPDDVTMLPDRLAALGVTGPDVGVLKRTGELATSSGATVTVDEVSEPKPGRSFAFVMDTAVCDAAVELGRDVDLLVAEATFLEPEADLAEAYGHLTAAQAARIARDAGARRLVLTHFSQRYPELDGHAAEAADHHDDVVVARDLDRISFPDAART